MASTNQPTQPVAGNRPKRRASVISPIKPTFSNEITVNTPNRTTDSKRVRFSGSDVPSNSGLPPTSTGLTPAVGRASLQTPKSKRRATPGRASDLTPSSTRDYDYVQFTPLRQALDERSKRRIRRNHLSEELNDYETDKRVNAQLKKDIQDKNIELEKLRAQLHVAQQSKDTKHTDDHAAAKLRVTEIEEELDVLRRSFGSSGTAHRDNVTWDHVPRENKGPGSEGGDTILIYEDDNDAYEEYHAQHNGPQDEADAALMGLELESARQAKQSMLSSFSRGDGSQTTSLHFADSPARPRPINSQTVPPATPRSLYHALSRQLKAATSRAEDAELALSALEGEIRALGFNNTEDTTASASLTILADHLRSIRLELEHVMPGETTISFENSELFPELMRKIKGVLGQLRSRDAEFRTLRSQERNLRGNFDHALVAADKAEAKIRDLEKCIDDLATDGMQTRIRAQELEQQRDEKSKDVEKLQVALNKHRDEITRLEDLIGKVESEHKDAMQKVKDESSTAWEQIEVMEAKVSAEETGRRKAEESAVARLKRIQDLEDALTKARENAEQVHDRLKTSEARHAYEVGSLNTRISTISTDRASADAEVEKLRQINASLEQKFRNEAGKVEKEKDHMTDTMVKAAIYVTEKNKGYKRRRKVRLANWELESDDMQTDGTGAPMTRSSIVRFADFDENEDGYKDDEVVDGDHVPGSVEMGRGRKKGIPLTPELNVTTVKEMKLRKGGLRYDSGIGMSSGSISLAAESDVEDDGVLEVSSEVDVDMGEGEHDTEVY